MNRQQGHGHTRHLNAIGEQTVAQTAKEVNRQVLERAVHRSLLSMGLCSHKAVKALMLTPDHCRKHSQRVRENHNWTMEQWK